MLTDGSDSATTLPSQLSMKPYHGAGRISLVLADVDGALVTKEKVLTDRAQASIAQIRERGIKFAVTSGRPPRGMKMINDALHLETPISGFNGGVITQPDYTVIVSRFLDPKIAQRSLEILQEHRLTAWLYTDTTWYVPNLKGPHVDKEAWTVKFYAKVATDFSSMLDRAVKIVGVSDDLEAVQQAEAAAQQALGKGASATRSQPYYLDITHPEATKGGVVAYLSEHLQVPTEEILTIGDMPNDVLMFNCSGLSVAMGNASPEVQAQANFVTDSCDDEGFAKAMEKHVLQPS